MSHSGTHSCTTRGHCTVHSQMFRPAAAHSPTAEVCMQQVVPNQLHIDALLSRRISFPLIYKPAIQEISFSISYKVCGFVVCIISPLTQFVNRLIPVFCKLSFLHDGLPPFAAGPCAAAQKAILFAFHAGFGAFHAGSLLFDRAFWYTQAGMLRGGVCLPHTAEKEVFL